MSSTNLNYSDSMREIEEVPPAQCTSTSGITDTDDSEALEQVTPIGRAVLQFLRQKRQGAKLADIVKHVRADRRGKHEKHVEKKEPEVSTQGVEVLERKNSGHYPKNDSMEPMVASTGEKSGRRRRPRKCACEHRRHCCDLPLKRRGRRNT